MAKNYTTLTASETYYLRVWDYGNNDIGTFDLCGYYLSCTPATVAYNVINDCDNSGGFLIEADITDMGSATSLSVEDDQGSVAQTANGISLLTFGPYTNGTDVVITATPNDNALCVVTSQTLSQAVCPPANDECANATTLECGTPLTGQTTAGATGGSSTSCVGSIGDDVWYVFSGNDSTVELTLNASVEEGQIGVYESTDGTCGGFTSGSSCIASGGSGGNPVNVSFDADAGTTYYIRVGNWINGDPGVDFDLSAACTPYPSCGEPTNLDATPSDTTAEISWSAPAFGTPVDYNWEIQPDGVAQGTAGAVATGTTAATMDTASGLSASTPYDLYVQANCDADGTSTWVGPYSFTTMDAPPACGENFYDTGGDSGNYSSNEDVTTTICPDVAGDAVSVTFTFFSTENNGTSCFDGLTIYDGADTSASTIDPPSGGTEWCWDRNDATPSGSGDLQGMTITSSDASGCLTFVFSSDSSATREGWEADVTCAPLSIEDYGLTGFSYYPNPVSDNLELNGVSNIQNVVVYNMLGQEVLKQAPNTVNATLNMANLNSGAYFVKVTIGNATKTVKVIKN